MVNIDELRELIDNNMKIDDIAIELSTSRSTIRRTMKKFDIKSKYIESKSYTTKCLNCEIDFKSTLCEERKFCSHSCSTTFNNKNRNIIRKNARTIKKCVTCNKEVAKGNTFCNRECYETDRKDKRHIFIKDGLAGSVSCKKYLIEKHGKSCMECGWDKVNPTTGNVPIELEHIDGNSENNNLDNLKLLCPNCHSLTPTYKALNLGNGRFKRRERYKEGKSS